jgi:DNA polymerase (family 10)
MRGLTENTDIASILGRVADLLDATNADPFRARAYRNGARVVRSCPRSMVSIFAHEGIGGLDELPGIGPTLAASIRELIQTGGLRYLRHLEGTAPAETLLHSVPGIGLLTAHHIHQELGIETLEELELAAHDGRLERLGGFGPRRILGLRAVLATMLSRTSKHHVALPDGAAVLEPPDVATLLSVDEEYRAGVDLGALERIAPKRFNPSGDAWLPILHTSRGDWHFTAMFSNTPRAHELHTTRDWVLLFFERNGQEGQATIVTETHGPMAGFRVIRGRERECAELLRGPASAA